MAGKSLLSFLAAPLMVAAVFVLMIGKANAYAVPSSGAQSSATSSTLDSSYDANNSFQNLISPFQNFFENLQSTNSSSVDIYPTSTMVPPINITPGVQNIFTQFNDWFYGLTGFRLSGLVVVVLTGLSWILGIAKGISDWLLALLK
jgi:hypothetical protein